jgi:hypothetical protein
MTPAPINLDNEIVATRYDGATRTCYYTIARDGKRWTAAVPLDHLEIHGPAKANRREHLARALMTAMAGPPDADLPAPADVDPFKAFAARA